MKAFLVSHGSYSDTEVDGIFSTREKAEEFMNLRALTALATQYPEAVMLDHRGCWIRTPDATEDYFNEIKEYEMDSLAPTEWVFATWKQHFGECENRDDVPGFLSTKKTLLGHSE